MTAVTAAVDIASPPSEVWRRLTDWAGQGQWMPMTTVVVAGGDGALGTRLVARTGIGPAAVEDPMTVDVWDPPHRCEVQHHGRVIRGRGIFVVEPLPGERSRLTWTEELEGAAARLSAPLSRVALQVALRRFSRRMV